MGTSKNQTVADILKRRSEQEKKQQQEQERKLNSQRKKELEVISKQNLQKELILQEIQNMPIISIACKKTNLPRATFYRWFKEDQKFRQDFIEAQFIGTGGINDLATSKVINKINEGDFPACKFWLLHNDRNFINPSRYIPEEPSGELTEQQQADIVERLKRWESVRPPGCLSDERKEEIANALKRWKGCSSDNGDRFIAKNEKKEDEE